MSNFIKCSINKFYNYKINENDSEFGLLIFSGIIWFFIGGFVCLYIQGKHLTQIVTLIEFIQLVSYFLVIVPLATRKATFFYVAYLMCYLNMSALWFVKAGEMAFAHLNIPHSDTLNLVYPDNWIVFGICLLPIAAIWYAMNHYWLDLRAWNEQARLPYFLDLKNYYYVVDKSGVKDKQTAKIVDKINDKYQALREQEHKTNDNFIAKLLRPLGKLSLYLFCIASAGAQVYPFVLSGNIKNSSMLFGAVALGSLLFAGVVYFIKRLQFQIQFERELGFSLTPVDRIPDFQPEIELPKPHKPKVYA